MKTMFKNLGTMLLVVLNYFLISFIVTVLTFIVTIFTEGLFYGNNLIVLTTFLMLLCTHLFYYFLNKKKKLDGSYILYNDIYVLFVCFIFTFIFVYAKASLLHPWMNSAYILAFPFVSIYSLMSLLASSYGTMIVVGSTLLYTLWLTNYFYKKKVWNTKFILTLGCAFLCFMTYFNSPHYKYKNQGHGFTYMDGYSSIDLSDYTPYSESSKLALLDHEPEFIIEKEEDMPVLDGAEACYPVYSALAKTLYKDIDLIEKEYLDTYKSVNGKIVTFYNTAIGFERLLSKEVDMFFGAKPSSSQLEEASRLGMELEYTTIGKEAFVFFVEEDNPMDGLTSEQIRQIYSGKITNWKEVGGKDEKIVAFQRPERSGSQSMMVYFMGDVPLKEPLTYEMEYAMLGIIEEVAQYQNEAGAIGYTFRYFLEGLNQVKGVKMLKVDGIYPTSESISQGTYPIVTSLYCITDKNTTHPNVKKVLDFLLSKDGQSLIKQNGYSPIN